MADFQWIHPGVALAALGLMGMTAWTKMRAKKYFRLHYTFALLTVAAVIVAFVLGRGTVSRILAECSCGRTDAFPVVILAHLPLSVTVSLIAISQAATGLAMLRLGRKPRLLHGHRYGARVLLGIGAAVLTAGVSMVYLILT